MYLNKLYIRPGLHGKNYGIAAVKTTVYILYYRLGTNTTHSIALAPWEMLDLQNSK